MNNDLLQKFLHLTLEKRQHEAAAKKLAERLATIEPRLIDEFAAANLQRVTFEGHTIYLNRQILANAAARQTPALCAAMIKLGAGDLVKRTINHQTLGAWVRELDRDANDLPILPAPLVNLIAIYERFSLRAVKAT